LSSLAYNLALVLLCSSRMGAYSRALTISDPVNDILEVCRDQRPATPERGCYHCQVSVPIWRRLIQAKFCSKEHEAAYFVEMESISLTRLAVSGERLKAALTRSESGVALLALREE